MVNFHQIEFVSFKANFELYRPFLIESAIPLVNNPESSFLIIEARLCSILVGLLVARLFTNQTAQLDSIFVLESERHKGIGTALFNFFQQTTLIDRKAIGFEYESESPYAPYLEKMIKKAGWSAPEFYQIRCMFDVTTFNPAWYQKWLHFNPSSFKIFPWKEISEDERDTILMQARQGRFQPYLSPLLDEPQIENINSLGLKHKDTLVGWMITHRLNLDTIKYSALYIEKGYRYAIWLLTQSIHLQQLSPIKWAYLEVNLKEIDRSWLSFLRKRLISHAYKIQKIKWAIYCKPN